MNDTCSVLLVTLLWRHAQVRRPAMGGTGESTGRKHIWLPEQPRRLVPAPLMDHLHRLFRGMHCHLSANRLHRTCQIKMLRA